MKFIDKHRDDIIICAGIATVLILIAVLLLLLTSCTCGFGGGGFSLEKFFGNPVIIVLIIAVIIWMYFKSKK